MTSVTAGPEVDAHARVSALVRRYGWNATSFQVLEPGYRYFFHGPDAAVAYVDTGRAWVAAGAPAATHAEPVSTYATNASSPSNQY